MNKQNVQMKYKRIANYTKTKTIWLSSLSHFPQVMVPYMLVLSLITCFSQCYPITKLLCHFHNNYNNWNNYNLFLVILFRIVLQLISIQERPPGTWDNIYQFINSLVIKLSYQIIAIGPVITLPQSKIYKLKIRVYIWKISNDWNFTW